MHFCRNCGQPVGEYDTYCQRCGAAQPNPASPNGFYRRFPAKDTANFGNGLVIGAGIVLLLGSLFLASALNSLFNTVSGYLAVEGLAVNVYAFGLADIARTISLLVFTGVTGVYLLIFGCIYQFSPKARQLMSVNSTTARFGASLMGFGIVFIVLPFSNYIYDLYIRPQAPTTFYLAMAAFGSIVLVAGVVLTAIAYYRSRNKSLKSPP